VFELREDELHNLWNVEVLHCKYTLSVHNVIDQSSV